MNSDHFLLEPSFFNKTSQIQLFIGLWSVLPILGVGLAFGFSAVAIPQFREPSIGIDATTDEESWIASVVTLTSPAGCLLSGYLTDRVGRRKLLIYCQAPMCLGWLVSACSSTATQMIIGRIIVGVGCGMSAIPPRIFLSEISLPNMRGVIGAIPNLAMAVGIMFQATLGSMFSWKTLCWLSVGFSIVVFLVNFLLPESPYFYLLKGNVEEAKACLRKLRSKDYDTETEINDMIEYRTDNNIHRLTIKQLIPALLQRASCRPFWIIMSFVLVGQLSGVSVMTFWTVEILQDARSVVLPTVGNIILSAVRMVFGLLCSVLLFQVGRRPLTFLSGFGLGVSFIVLGVYTMKTSGPNIFAMLLTVSYVAFGAIGYYSLPLMLMSEMYPLQMRGILGGITVSLSNIIVFVCNKYYPFIKLTWGFDYTVMAMGISALLGVIYLYVVLPETKDLTLTEIEEYFNGRVSTPLSHRMLVNIQSAQRASGSSQPGDIAV